MSPKILNILLVLLPVVIYFGYLNPAYTGDPGLIWTPEASILTLKTQNVQYQNILGQIDLVEQGMTQLSKDYNAIPEETKQKIGIMLPDSVDDIKLRNEVILIAAQSNLAVSNLRVIKDIKGEPFYRVSFTIKSRYPAFKKFMENYEKNMRLFVLEEATIQRPEKIEGQVEKTIEDDESLNIIITSRVHYLK